MKIVKSAESQWKAEITKLLSNVPEPDFKASDGMEIVFIQDAGDIAMYMKSKDNVYMVARCDDLYVIHDDPKAISDIYNVLYNNEKLFNINEKDDYNDFNDFLRSDKELLSYELEEWPEFLQNIGFWYDWYRYNTEHFRVKVFTDIVEENDDERVANFAYMNLMSDIKLFDAIIENTKQILISIINRHCEKNGKFVLLNESFGENNGYIFEVHKDFLCSPNYCRNDICFTEMNYEQLKYLATTIMQPNKKEK